MFTLHASGLHSTTNADLRTQVAAWIDEHAPAYLTHTEAVKHRSALTLHVGYGVVHPRGDEGEAECAIQYRLDGPKLLRGRAVRLSSKPIPRRAGDFCYATHAEFADHHRIVIHLPSGVEGPNGLLDGPQSDVYRDAIGGLRRLVAGLTDKPVVIVGDWNISLSQERVQEYLRLHFPDFTPTAIPASEPGTHGSRHIDFSLVRGYTATGDVVANPTSDHRALLERITPKEPTVTTRMLTDLADVLRGAGLKVVEVDGWKTRTRPASTGSFTPVGILWHHTGATADGASYATWLAKVGRSDLPAPLCQLSVSRDGTWYVIAAGRANHAGQAKASGTVAAGDGNRLYLGVECMNNGTEGWSKAQYASMVKGGAALGKYLGCSIHAQRAHKETSVTGKWDPGALDMDRFRRDIAAAMAPARKPTSTPTRVSRARVLLTQALKFAGPRRKAAILAALARLPKR